MYVIAVKSPYTKLHTLYLVEGYRTKDGQTRQRRLKQLGVLERLQKDEPNVLARLKAEAKAMTQAKKEEEFFNMTLSLNQKSDSRFLNFGYVFLEQIFNRLKIDEFLQAEFADRKIEYDLSEILRLITYERILNPGSKRNAFLQKDRYFKGFSDVKLENIYRSLSELFSVKDKFLMHLHKAVCSEYTRDCSLVFYDVTNYYFESEVESDLKKPGVCKSKTKNPIIQMGLFIDNNGIPITYELFAGSTNDLSTMRPILERVKAEFNLGKITIVADKGNNSGTNLEFINANDDFYVISQKIRGRGSKIADIVLEQDGYETNPCCTFKSKTVQVERKTSNGTITENMICFWSQKEADYQAQKREGLEMLIEKFVSNPPKLAASNRFGVKKYLSVSTVDKTTGEVLKGKSVVEFDKAKYERDCALDGYYCIVTNNLELSPLEVIKTYKGLYKIEDSFRVTKTDLEGRPVFVWKDSQIQGHFFSCYLSLLILRILQLKLGGKYSCRKIVEALNAVALSPLEQGIYNLCKLDEIVLELAENELTTIEKKYLKEEHISGLIKRLSVR